MKRIVLVGVSLALVGCAKSGVSDPVMETEVCTEQDTAVLGSIVAPVFGDEFLVLRGKESVGVTWGISDDGLNVMWESSGYPGFDYPMAVTIADRVFGDSVELVTSYGTYEYSLVDSFTAYRDGDQLKLWSGKQLINWGKKGEVLYLWDSNTKYCYKYRLVRGTKIVL